MSVLSTIVADVKTFFSDLSTDAGKFSAAFVALFKKAPSALQVVQNFIGEVAPIVVAAVGLADPTIDAPVTAALATVETGLAAVQATLTAAVSGTSLLTSLESFASSVPSLLTGLDIKDAALQAKITSLVNLVTNEAKVLIPAVESWVAQIAGTSSATTTTAS